MGGKAKAPPPPDYSGIANASAASAASSLALGREQLQWAREQYYSDKATTDAVTAKFMQSQDEQDANARKDRARYEQVYQPLENDLVRDAKDYSSQDRIDQNMGRAQANVAQQFDQQRNASLQSLESFGIDPSSTRYAALDVGQRAARAAASAAAGNQAKEQTEAIGRTLRSEAINIGRGLPGQVASSYGQALQAGQAGVNTTLAQTASGANTMGTGTQWTGAGNQALGTWGNALSSGYNAQMSAFNAKQNQSSGIGSALGLVGGLATAFMEDGGAIDDRMAEMDGAIADDRMVRPEQSPSQGIATDDVSARLNVGEFVFPKDVMAWKGEEWAQKEILKARQQKEGAQAKPEIKNAPAQAPQFSTAGAIAE